MKLILLTLALLLFLIAGLPFVPTPYEPWRFRFVALGLAAWVAANYPWP